jgi:hypothetical protein
MVTMKEISNEHKTTTILPITIPDRWPFSSFVRRMSVSTYPSIVAKA